MSYPVRSILAATDLGPGSDAIVRSAGRLAARIGAELHVVHALELTTRSSDDERQRSEFQGAIETARDQLQQQIDRTLPEDVQPASQRTVIYEAHKAILDRAKEITADLIVVGPHRGGEVGAHFLGTTADGVIRGAQVPCLVVDEPLADPVERIGVPVDLSDPSRSALEVAFAWGVRWGEKNRHEREDSPEVRVMHVGWPVEKVDNPDMEEELIRPQLERQIERALSAVPEARALESSIEVVWDNDTTDATVRWAGSRQIDLLVMGTRGSTGLTRVMLGSTASRVARKAPCPVLLVPPTSRSSRADEPRLERVMTAVDFSESSREIARWSIRELAPEAEHLLCHVIEVPEPPAVLAGRYGSREELLQTAREGAQKRMGELQTVLETAQPEKGKPSISARLLEGRSADVIIREAGEANANIIVIGRHGRGKEASDAGNVFGTNAERLVRASPVPVLVGGKEMTGPPRRMLVAVDGSDASRRALRWADFFRRRFDGSLTVIHVESPFIYQYADMVPEREALAEAAGDDTVERPGWMEEREEWLREEMRQADVDVASTGLRVAIGRPAVEILAEQDRISADLIAIGTHGRSAVGRVLLGSAAGTVLRKASCSVLVTGDPGRV